MKNLILVFLLFQVNVMGQTVDAGDTIVFDLLNASCNQNTFEIPISFQSDDSVYAVDFSMQFNTSNISFNSVTVIQPGMSASAFFNSSDTTLRFTSFSMTPLPAQTIFATVRFNMLSLPVTLQDFDSIRAYLNGDGCSYRIIPPSASASITYAGNLSVLPGDTLVLSVQADSSHTVLWSTGDSTTSIYVTDSGTYSVHVITSGGCVMTDSVVVRTGVPLPVMMTSFKAIQEEGMVIIHWITSSEINCDYFEVRRSLNGTDWLPVTKVDGAGNSTETNEYLIADHDASRGINFYQLLQSDFDGSIHFSEVIAVDVASVNGISVFPNPASTILFIKSNGEMVAHVYDLTGAEVIAPFTIHDGIMGQLNVAGLAEGRYFMRFEDLSGEISFVICH